MNEKLEREAVSFCYDNGINISPRQATNIANHFYNLALADVRGEVERTKDVIYNGLEWDDLDEAQRYSITKMCRLITFIDNLIK